MKKKPLWRGGFPAAPVEVLADRGREALRVGRFKEAMEVFKQLARQDGRPEWTERLADAYAGRAHALAEKGMFKEAAMVLENTRTTAGMVREPVLYLTSLVHQGQYQKAHQAALHHIDRVPAAETNRVAGMAAVLSLVVPMLAEAQGAKPPGGTPWLGQCCAARAALDAWLQGKPYDEVEHLLSRIPLRSSFGPLRLILKSLVTPSDAQGKALGLLAMVPPDSSFAPVATAATAALTDDPAALLARLNGLRPAQQAFAVETRGVPPAASAMLSQIVEAERRGAAALFALLVKPGLPLPEHDLRIACLNLLPEIPDCLTQFDRRFGAASTVERGRILALAAETRDNWLQAQAHWDAVAEALSAQLAPDALLAHAVVLRHLADLALHHPEMHGELGTDPVADYLERSLVADPDHLPATLALLEHYRTTDSPKDWHRTTDRATQRFPGSTVILLHAVDAAVARDAYKKAAGFARRLLALDPINQPVRQRMIELQLAHARKQMRAGRADLAGKALAQAAEWEPPDTPSAPLRIGQALVATHGDQTEAGETRLREAVQLGGGGIAGWFRAALEAALMGWPEQHRTLLHRELAAAQTGEPNRDAILALIGILGQKEIRDSKKAVASVLWRIEPTLMGGSGIAWPPAEFQTVAASLHHLGAFDALTAYARGAMQRDAGDQAARFYRIVAQSKGDRDRLTDAQEAELYDLMEQAGARQDFHMVNRVKRLLEGPDIATNGAGRSARGGLPERLSVADMGEFLGDALAGIAGVPQKEVRKLVNKVGRNHAIAMLADMMADTPFADILSDQQLEELCASIVSRAVEGRSQPARR
jgi:tetratricopeptide (TPR) repeat protein